LVEMDFYDSLLSSTSTLFIVVLSIMLFHKHVLVRRATSAREKEEVMRQARFFAGYMLLFAFPIVRLVFIWLLLLSLSVPTKLSVRLVSIWSRLSRVMRSKASSTYRPTTASSATAVGE
jgi:hypothetical protein